MKTYKPKLIRLREDEEAYLLRRSERLGLSFTATLRAMIRIHMRRSAARAKK